MITTVAVVGVFGLFVALALTAYAVYLTEGSGESQCRWIDNKDARHVVKEN
jgi:hypothetical protein